MARAFAQFCPKMIYHIGTFTLVLPIPIYLMNWSTLPLEVSEISKMTFFKTSMFGTCMTISARYTLVLVRWCIDNYFLPAVHVMQGLQSWRQYFQNYQELVSEKKALQAPSIESRISPLRPPPFQFNSILFWLRKYLHDWDPPLACK